MHRETGSAATASPDTSRGCSNNLHTGLVRSGSNTMAHATHPAVDVSMEETAATDAPTASPNVTLAWKAGISSPSMTRSGSGNLGTSRGGGVTINSGAQGLVGPVFPHARRSSFAARYGGSSASLDAPHLAPVSRPVVTSGSGDLDGMLNAMPQMQHSLGRRPVSIERGPSPGTGTTNVMPVTLSWASAGRREVSEELQRGVVHGGAAMQSMPSSEEVIRHPHSPGT